MEEKGRREGEGRGEGEEREGEQRGKEKRLAHLERELGPPDDTQVGPPGATAREARDRKGPWLVAVGIRQSQGC